MATKMQLGDDDRFRLCLSSSFECWLLSLMIQLRAFFLVKISFQVCTLQDSSSPSRLLRDGVICRIDQKIKAPWWDCQGSSHICPGLPCAPSNVMAPIIYAASGTEGSERHARCVNGGMANMLKLTIKNPQFQSFAFS